MRLTLWIAIVVAFVPLACGYQKPNGEVTFITVDTREVALLDLGLMLLIRDKWISRVFGSNATPRLLMGRARGI